MNQSEKLKGNIKKVSEGLLTTPKRVIPPATNISSAWVDVSDGSMLRVRVAALTYLEFRDSDPSATAVAATSPKAIELSVGTHMIAISGKFVRASVNPARVEVLA